MKFKVKVSDAKNFKPYVFKFGYCQVQSIENILDNIAYAEGVNGLKFNLYYVNDRFALTTGYAPVGIEVQKEIKDLIQELELKIAKDTRYYQHKEKYRAELIEIFELAVSN